MSERVEGDPRFWRTLGKARRKGGAGTRHAFLLTVTAWTGKARRICICLMSSDEHGEDFMSPLTSPGILV